MIDEASELPLAGVCLCGGLRSGGDCAFKAEAPDTYSATFSRRASEIATPATERLEFTGRISQTVTSRISCHRWESGMAAGKLVIPAERIERVILSIHGQRVLLDTDLAALYGVTTKRLNEQVRRNRARFPADFMFQLSAEDAVGLRSQIATLAVGRGKHRKYRPYAFTEQGVAMLSSVLRSARAIEVNIAIMRAFVRLREILSAHKELAGKLEKMEKKLGAHDQQFQVVFEAIRQLMSPPPESPKKRRIGFHRE